MRICLLPLCLPCCSFLGAFDNFFNHPNVFFRNFINFAIADCREGFLQVIHRDPQS
ncbi:hypothetical protein FIBSPDRAFT_854375 [Athelia psychrophila]|uniref:Uncharacterized protein n=1 Tax=Athelia psychrophila TaxID=1759441 RepID=A0A166QE67_9AGAM|nr:hypothetical protein FIBSPDRAFT_854375 [Fibularhizoctonia sp. CBS 109695]